MLNRGIFIKCISSSLKLLLISFLCLLLHGCIGIGIAWVGDISRSSESSGFSNEGKDSSSTYLVSKLGQPHHREQIDGGSEIWEYRGENLRWHGVVPILLLPLPLVVPFGYENTTFVIQDGRIRSAVRTYWDFKFAIFCGYVGLAPVCTREIREGR